jgi:hypothetical protein
MQSSVEGGKFRYRNACPEFPAGQAARGSVVRQLGTLRWKCPGVGRLFNGTTDVVQLDQIDQIAVI